MSYPPPQTVGKARASTLDLYRHLGKAKTGDTTRNSGSTGTALTLDPDLQFGASDGLAANATYLISFRLVTNTGSTPQFKWDLTIPSGASFSRYSYLAWGTVNAHDLGVMPGASNVAVAVGDGNDRPLYIDGTLIIAGTVSTFGLRWAQNVSSATNTILRAGSSLHLVRMA